MYGKEETTPTSIRITTLPANEDDRAPTLPNAAELG
jgi:hypothetical protein